MPQKMIAQHQVCHGFHDGNGAGKNAGVVTATGFQDRVFMLTAHGGLRLQDGGGGFEGDAEDDVLSVADAALDAAAAVRARADTA